ncbi:DNA-binding transcriptional activator of the SARP family [Micromonospora echinaurantiaca]|uniref:DNA-binding transcriptional activator of the SARP family n=1 Tax=Micromonospora echinaurantiaca TaxID=47857 RepID=A0A1C5KAP2_9ACTN|nr:BTAD domain-containing putative transcriptional regulator [Micromonospora echinaurantiaca]SCG79885.1 DNA-binding transcriptional activator of the SARP family [Micromonospora echinaurantiaca]
MTSPLSFAVLGPVRAWAGQSEIDLGTRQQRLILALLLARAGGAVSVTELVDLLWESDPPASAVNVVHRHVGMLRRRFEPGLPTRAAGSVLIRDGAEYRLRMDRESLDLLRFRRLVAQAEGSSGEPAIEFYREALALWRDRCAAGLQTGGRTHPEFVAVDGERYAAVRAATDAALRAGRVHAVLPAIRLAADQEPLDEALQARLLLALAADGRRAEALAAYADIEHRLADELGIQPGADLRAARDSLLDHVAPADGAGSRHGVSPAFIRSGVPFSGAEAELWPPAELELSQPTRVEPPAQLPADHPYFTGRRGVVAAVKELLAGDPRPTALVIDGMPGVGKSTLAVHLAHQLAARYPDGQLHADLRAFDSGESVMTPAEALRGFLWSLGVAPAAIPAELHAQAGLYRSILAERRMLILLDNCRDWDHIRHLLPGTGSSLVIATSRRRITGVAGPAGAHPLHLDLLTDAEARELLARWLGEAAATDPAVDEIIARCGRLPLALALVATRSVGRPGLSLPAVAGELAEADGRLSGFGDAHADLEAIFSWSYRALTPEAARLFRLLPLHPTGELSTEAAAALGGLPPRSARGLLAELGAQLLVQPSDGRWRMHDLLRAYAAELGEEHDDAAVRNAAIERVYDYYQLSAYAAHLPLQPQVPLPEPEPAERGVTGRGFTGRADAMDWFAVEQRVLTEIVARAGERRPHTAWRIALALQNFFQDTAQFKQWAAAVSTALAVTGDDPAAQALLHRSLAGACYFLADLDRGLSHLQHARALFDRLGRRTEQGHVENNIAEIRLAQRRYHEAIRHAEAARALLLAEGNVRGATNSLLAIARAQGWLGRHAEALGMFVEARRQFEVLGDLHGMGTTQAWLAHTYSMIDDLPHALAIWQQAIDTFRGAQATHHTAEVLVSIGDFHSANGDPALAGQAWSEALAELDGTDSPMSREIRVRLRWHG